MSRIALPRPALPRPVLLGSVLLLAACGGPSEPEEAAYEVLSPELVARAESVRERALRGRGAYDFLEALTTEVGPRFAGTAGNLRGVEWARDRLRELGFAEVRAEEVTVPRWVRGHAAGEIVAPHPQPVVLTALGGSVGTPRGGVEAEVVEAAGLDELAQLPRSRVAGKIVFLNRRMRRTRDGSGYGETVPIRSRGAARAGELGAVAVLIRSVGTSNARFPHTGAMRYEEDGPKIPAAALAIPDADLLEAQLRRGPVRFRLDLGSRHLGDAPSANVLGEVPGREKPEEIVLMAAHLDSWDLGTGAIDDGAGCAIVTEAARLLGELDPPPRRTVRVWLTANEEFGLSGARAYAERYEYDLGLHAAAMESDLGAGAPWILRSRVAEEALPVVRDLARLLAPLGIEYQGNEAWGGADLIPLRPHRIPFFDLPQDATRYFDYHHTADDTFDKIDPEDLAKNVAAYAVAALVAAEVDVELGPAPAFEE